MALAVVRKSGTGGKSFSAVMRGKIMERLGSVITWLSFHGCFLIKGVGWSSSGFPAGIVSSLDSVSINGLSMLSACVVSVNSVGFSLFPGLTQYSKTRCGGSA